MISVITEPHEAISYHNGDFAIVADYGNKNKPGATITVFNFKRLMIEKIIDLGENALPHGLAIIPGQNILLVTTEGKNGIMAVNIETGIVEKLITTNEKKPHMIVVHPNGQFAYVTNYLSNSVSEIDISEGVVLQSIYCGKGPEGIDISSDGGEVWVTNELENTVSVIDTRNMIVIDELPTNEGPVRAKFTNNGLYCIVSNANAGNISVFDADNKKMIKVIALPGNRNLLDKLIHKSPRPVGITMHPNGMYAFVSNSNADKVLIIDLEQLTLVSDLPTGRIPDGIVCSNN